MRGGAQLFYNSIDYNDLFRNKFNPANRELERLKSKINQKEGFWIFQSHCYSKGRGTPMRICVA